MSCWEPVSNAHCGQKYLYSREGEHELCCDSLPREVMGALVDVNDVLGGAVDTGAGCFGDFLFEDGMDKSTGASAGGCRGL